jgi:DNA adenine methylase
LTIDTLVIIGDARCLTYLGGKNGAGTYQRLINAMPPHEVYIEPFLGSGAVLRLKRPAFFNIGIDLSQDAIVTFQKHAPARLGRVRFCEGLPNPLWPRSPLVEIDDGGLPKSCLYVGDGLSFIELGSRAGTLGETALVYCDPPYLWSTRSGRHCYQHEFSDDEHQRLLEWADAAKCRVMISGYWSTLYGSSLRKWRCESFFAMTRGGRMAEEYVWSNFKEPTQLHDYTYLGSGWRERERIRRKKARWTARLERMPTLEKQALLSAIDEVFRD